MKIAANHPVKSFQLNAAIMLCGMTSVTHDPKVMERDYARKGFTGVRFSLYPRGVLVEFQLKGTPGAVLVPDSFVSKVELEMTEEG